MRYGFIDKNGGSGVPLEKIQIRGNIKGFTAEVLAIMEYKNNSDSPIEAIYVFPLDEEAAVCGFQATIDGRTIVADPRKARSSRYSATVELTFVTTLSVEKEGRAVFVLPAVLNPRYSPSDSKPSVSTTLPTIASVSTKYSFDFVLEVQCASLIEEITSPCNPLKVDINPEDNRQATVRLGEEFKFDADVQVHVLCSKPFEPHALVENGVIKLKDGIKDEFLSKPVVMLNFFPELDSSASLDRGEFIFVVDRSGSMDGSKIKSARETLLLFLKSLPEGCYFNVIGFGSSFEKLFPKSESYDDSSLNRACSHGESMEADLGGTEILAPFQDVFSQPLIKGYPRQVFLLTDGEVGNTQQVIELVRTNATRARCFTFGIGAGASTALVKGVARAGKGMAEFVASGDKLRAKVIKVLKNALQPALLDCEVTWDLPEGCSAKSIPDVPPPIFSGNSLIMYGLVSDDSLNAADSNSKGSITLSATLTTGAKVEKVQHKLSLESLSSKSGDDSLLLHRLAAKVLIQEKQDNDNNAALNEEIVKISKSANVVSKLTSFVAVDKDSNIPVCAPLAMPTFKRAPFRCRPVLNFAFRSRRTRKQDSNIPVCAFIATESKVKNSDDRDLALAPPLPRRVGQCLLSSRASARRVMNSDRALPSSASNAYDPIIKDRLYESMDRADLSASSSLPQKGCLEIVSLQKASGAWQLTAQLASICGVTLDKLKQTCPSQLTTDNKDSLWATAIALSCLAGKFADQKDEWEMVAAKGTKWLKANLHKNGLSYDGIMEMAGNVLTDLCYDGPSVYGGLKAAHGRFLVEREHINGFYGAVTVVLVLHDGQHFGCEAFDVATNLCFTFGIGAGASTALVKGVARAGKGMAEFVASGDKLRAKVIKVLKNALQPALLDCQVTWDLPEGRSAKNIPDVPPPIFSGNSLIMYGLVSDDSLNAVDSNSKGSITLSATLAIGAKVEKIQHQLRLESLSSKSGHNSLLLHRLAAKVLIQEKQDNDNNAALNEEIVKISKSANVVSKLTSFVAVDKDSNIPVSAPLAKPSLQDEFSLMTPCGFMAPRVMRRRSQENFRILSSKSGHNSLLLHRLAAKVLIQEKQDNDNNAALNEEIVKISKSANVVSKLTSFVAVDKDSNIPVCAFIATESKVKNSDDRDLALPPPLPRRVGQCLLSSRASARRVMNSDRALPPPLPARCLRPCLSSSRASARRVMNSDRALPSSASNAYDPIIKESMDRADLSASSSLPQKGCLEIVSLQKASGAWKLTAQLASICGVPLDKLKQTCPSQLTTDNKDSLWATAIALLCLAGKFADQKDEWEMVAAKGTKWLKANLHKDGLSYDGIMEMAGNVLTVN
ncbi:hypothetical protein QZH41_019314 [Actinostola sp. cb2023]|nr:hypothetical protein QZH41_019314 [Actinostola sp. cb2023]